jgi:hypothetical protein
MGYTHYWTFYRSKLTPEALENGFYRASQHVKACKKYLPPWIKIRVGLGHGNPKIYDKEIWFNGDAKSGADHETFHIPQFVDDLQQYWKDEGFCKTARKPYDILVVCSLLALAREFPEVFYWSSDGDEHDLRAAREHFEGAVERQFRHALKT